MNPEGDDEAHLQLHPEHRGIEEEMLAWVAETWSMERVLTWARQHDSYRRDLLRFGGWEEGEVDGSTHRRSLDGEPPPRPIAEGYVVRPIDLTLRDDAERRAAISREVFGRERTAELAAVLRHAPGYRPDLDLVAVAPDGTFASNTTVWLDAVNRYAVFEPVGTHPEHRRRGLASAVIAEGLRRAVAGGITTAYVGSGTGRRTASTRRWDSTPVMPTSGTAMCAGFDVLSNGKRAKLPGGLQLARLHSDLGE